MSVTTEATQPHGEESERQHPTVVHMHDHFHVAHVQSETEASQTQQVYWHTHEHEHDKVIGRDDVLKKETEDHPRVAHIHDHDQHVERPT